jgi:hypothetical protein
VVAKVRERLAVSKQTAQNFDVERFTLRKINELEVRKEYQSEISNRFAALENVSDNEDILPVVLYGCETWSLTLREESWLRVFENRVLKRIFSPNRDEVTGEWKKLQNEELNGLYCLHYCVGDKIEKSDLGGACNACGGE